MAVAPVRDYNYAVFGARQALADARRTARAAGVAPGAEAPDFELPLVDGGSMRLSDLRGWPVVLRFGSPT